MPITPLPLAASDRRVPTEAVPPRVTELRDLVMVRPTALGFEGARSVYSWLRVVSAPLESFTQARIRPPVAAVTGHQNRVVRAVGFAKRQSGRLLVHWNDDIVVPSFKPGFAVTCQALPAKAWVAEVIVSSGSGGGA